MEFDEGINLTLHGSAAVLTLSNPGRRNAFYPEMRRKLTAHIRALCRNLAVKSIIITGADGHFCAGADLSRVAARKTPPTALETRENMKEVLELFRVIATGSKPVIAAVDGDAFGAGCSIALACDVVVATPTSRFGIAFAKIGLVPDMGMLYSLPERVGRPMARRLMMKSAVVVGDEAVELGMADEMAPVDSALNRALLLAEEYEDMAPMSIALIKAALGSGIVSVEDAIRSELDLVPLAVSSADCREGIAAIREKRKPSFKGC